MFLFCSNVAHSSLAAMASLILKTNFRKGSEKVRKSGKSWGRECVWDVGSEEDSEFFLFFKKSDYSPLNETAQFNCPEFMGLTIGEDYVSGILWRKKLPGSPTFTGNCYYRCGNSLLVVREFLGQESQVGFADEVVGRRPKLYASEGIRKLLELGVSALYFRRMQQSIICVFVEMYDQFYVSIDFILPRSCTKLRSSQRLTLSGVMRLYIAL